MGAGEAGIAGDHVLPLAEEVKRLGNGCATIQSHLKVVAPAQETLLRCPDAMCMRAQVSNGIRLRQDHYQHIYSLSAN